ncbi:ParB/RepB/Spo0J family partition protein [Massilia antarctica]|uniref:ParB/RepB/Spo0J family partition protein n=1 Tax=Massilia antarctica TaxID=2765360 RepID=UPI00226F3F6E|nr:ParB/RepB/Spo0J family partition protein [Massilia sp. H27-R4]MCY0916448.1 ParB/RepB/Spo0J family partition protein [Massilia sp. H27-R4]
MKSRQGVKVSGLVAQGKLVPKAGVQISHAFDAPSRAAEVAELEQPGPTDEQEGQTAQQQPNAHIASAAQSIHPLVLADSAKSTDWALLDDYVCMIGVELVVDSPFQTEEESGSRYDPESIDELAHTMAKTGQQEPITVRWVNGSFELINGHRRIRAASSMGWTKICARIIKRNDAEAEKGLMVHNEGRKDNSDYAKAKLYARAKDKGYAKTQDDLAHMFATKQSSVSKRLAMLTLPDPILKILNAQPDLIGMGTAKTILELIAELPGELDTIVKAVERIKQLGAPENSVRSWVAQMVQGRLKGHAKAEEPTRKPKVITDPANRQLYTAKLEGRVITFRVSASDLDPQEELNLMLEYFQNRANARSTSSPPKE